MPKYSDEIVFRALDDIVSAIGIFRTFQLLNDIEINNYILARKYPPLSPSQVHLLRDVACEYRLCLKKNVQEHLTSQINISLTA